MGDSSLKIKIGIIGGSCFDENIFVNQKEKKVTTPFGDPSDSLIEGEISGIPCISLARHNRNHNIMPSNVNYRANIWALKEAGCTHIIVSTAIGSLRENIKPGDFIVVDSFIDRTQGRESTFFDGKPGHPKGVVHIPMHPAYNERMRQIIIKEAKKMNHSIHESGTYVCVQGPRFSSKAESLMHRILGGDVVGMTAIPEVPLAKEASLLYAAVGLVTDYDCWKDRESVSVNEVVETFHSHKPKLTQLIINVIEEIAKEDWTYEIEAAKNLVILGNMTK